MLSVCGFSTNLAKLQDALITTQEFLLDAEEKEIKDKAVRKWLKKLEEIAFEADNVLDEFNYHILRENKKRKTEKVSSSSPATSVSFTLSKKMARKIKHINKKFEKINNVARRDGLIQAIARAPNVSAIENFESDSFLLEPNMVGREIEVAKIVEMVVNEPVDGNISVIPIVGMGGLGKTAVAQRVFHHEVIINHFEVGMWVCASSHFDEFTLFQKILETLTREDVQGLLTKEVLLQKIRMNLTGKRFLLILDDVWNVDPIKWERFVKTLSWISNVTQNAIIITTRQKSVALLTKTLSFHKLTSLSTDDCWSIIKSKALSSMGNSLEFEEIGISIAKTCGGLPLAANVIGGMLRVVPKEEWSFILKNQLPSFARDFDNHVMKILKLSYYRLPSSSSSSSSLKKCFLYCTVFPCDSQIKKETLIEQWLAEGFLGYNEENDHLENIGSQFFDHLLDASLIQEVERDYFGNITHVTMHRFVHDLACSISDNGNIMNKFRYFHLNSHEPYHISQEQGKILRTLILDSEVVDKTFSGFSFLHVLKLDSSIEELPVELVKQIHMRFLDISSTKITKLPDSIKKLSNLLILVATNLQNLPNTIIDLIKLRHLHISSIDLPPFIGKLTSLQTLPYYKVGHANGCRIGELENLKNLKGSLEIHYLERVKDKAEAMHANLFGKPNILRLVLDWTRLKGGKNDENVLEGLQPHPNLKSLVIYGYGVINFPSWTMKMTVYDAEGRWAALSNLINIKIEDCECEKLPSLGHLPRLKSVDLINLQCVQSIDRSFYGLEYCSTSSMIDEVNILKASLVFPALERLRLLNMPNLMEWADVESGVATFQRHVYLEIKSCPRLKSVPSCITSFHGLSQNSRYIYQRKLETGGVSNYPQESDFEDVKSLSWSTRTMTNVHRNVAGHDMHNVEGDYIFGLSMLHDGDEGPGIEGLQIIGEAKPGCRLLACGYPVRGISLCMFQWVRQYPDGTRQYIEGATNPDYILTAEDVDKIIAVECTPVDEQGRQGEIVRIFANDYKKIKCASFVLPHETLKSELGKDSFAPASFTVNDIIITPTDIPFDSISASPTLRRNLTLEIDEVMTEVMGTEFTTKESKMVDDFVSDASAKEESESISAFHKVEPELINITDGIEIESTSPMEIENASPIYDTLSLLHHDTTLHEDSITIAISATGKLHEYADLELVILHASLSELQHVNWDTGNLDLDNYPDSNEYLFLVKRKRISVNQESMTASNQSLASFLGCQLNTVLPPQFLIYERVATEEEWSQACVVILTENDHAVNSVTNGLYRCPNLAVLFLQGENTLSYISSSFFNFMPALRFLDLSGTRSRKLPSSIFNLDQLQVLLLKNCPCLVEIPTEIVNLHHLQVLDISGSTELHNLPVHVGQLINLKEFQVSLYGPDDESEHVYLPPELLSRGILLKLQELEALSIVVHPEDHRWRKMASDFTQDIIELKNLRHLQFYFPAAETFETFITKSPSWKTLRTFKLVVGHDVKRIASRVPAEVEIKYNQQARCVRFVNGYQVELPKVIKIAVERATAFCLDHHLHVRSLSQFGISNLKELKFCVVRECPNFKVFADNKKKKIEAIMPSLEFLGIHYLWNLQSIWSSVHMAKGSFNALKRLTVYTCPRLKFILPTSMFPLLTSLEELVVVDCEAVTRITKGKVKNDVENNTATLPRLKRVELRNLLRLVRLGDGIFATRTEIIVVGCPGFSHNAKPENLRPLCCLT